MRSCVNSVVLYMFCLLCYVCFNYWLLLVVFIIVTWFVSYLAFRCGWVVMLVLVFDLVIVILIADGLVVVNCGCLVLLGWLRALVCGLLGL